MNRSRRKLVTAPLCLTLAFCALLLLAVWLAAAWARRPPCPGDPCLWWWWDASCYWACPTSPSGPSQPARTPAPIPVREPG